MNDQTRPKSVPPAILAALEQSNADMEAGRIEDLDVVLKEMRERIERYAAARNKEGHSRPE